MRAFQFYGIQPHRCSVAARCEENRFGGWRRTLVLGSGAGPRGEGQGPRALDVRETAKERRSSRGLVRTKGSSGSCWCDAVAAYLPMTLALARSFVLKPSSKILPRVSISKGSIFCASVDSEAVRR